MDVAASQQPPGASPVRRVMRAPDPVAMLEALPARIAIWGSDLRLVHANARQLDFVGLARDQIIGRTMLEAVGPQSMEALSPYVDGALRGDIERWTGLTRRADGTAAESDYLVAPVTVPGGRGTGLVFLTVDARTRVRDSSSALVHQSMVRARCDQLRDAAELSRHVADQLALAGQALDLLTSAQDPDASYLEVISLLATGITALRDRLKTLLDDPDPRAFARVVPDPVTLQVEPVQDPPSRPLDTGDPRIESPAASPSPPEALLLAALDALPCAVSSWTPDLTCTYANPAVQTWLGCTRDQLVGSGGRDLLETDAFRACLDAARLAMSGQPQSFLRNLPSGDGPDRWAHVDFIGQFGGGRPTGVVVFSRDVTAEVEAQRSRAVAEHQAAELGRRRAHAEHDLDPLLQRLFALTLTLSAIRPAGPRSHEVAADLSSISGEVRALINDHTLGTGQAALPWPALTGAPADAVCRIAECVASAICDSYVAS